MRTFRCGGVEYALLPMAPGKTGCDGCAFQFNRDACAAAPDCVLPDAGECHYHPVVNAQANNLFRTDEKYKTVEVWCAPESALCTYRIEVLPDGSLRISAMATPDGKFCARLVIKPDVSNVITVEATR